MSSTSKGQQRERKYIVDYVRMRWPDAYAMFNFRVGAMPTKLEGVDISGLSPNIYKVFNRYVDALVVLPDKLVLIEAKMIGDLGAVSQLEYYASIVRQTPELAQYASLPLELHIVSVYAEPTFVAFANSKNIIIDVYRTPEAVAYVSEKLKGAA